MINHNKIRFYVLIITLITITILGGACTSSRNRPPEILGLEASTLYVYPLGTTEIQCIVSDPDGDDINFKWSCTNGTFIGTGPVVKWKAPNNYGDYHIMVVTNDNNGASNSATVTISVMYKQYQQRSCCGR